MFNYTNIILYETVVKNPSYMKLQNETQGTQKVRF